MATARQVFNFADGGLNMFQSATGGCSGGVTSPAAPNATYCMSIAAGSENCRLDIIDAGSELSPGTATTSPYKATFKFRTTDATPAAAIDFFSFRDNSGTVDSAKHITLRLRTDGDVEIRSGDNGTVDATISAPFTADTWHDISVWFQLSATGDAEVVIDGASTTTNSKDYAATDGTNVAAHWQNAASSSTTIYVADRDWETKQKYRAMYRQ